MSGVNKLGSQFGPFRGRVFVERRGLCIWAWLRRRHVSGVCSEESRDHRVSSLRPEDESLFIYL